MFGISIRRLMTIPVLLVLVAAGFLLVSRGDSASAQLCTDRASEQDLLDSGINCRHFILDPGQGALVSRELLLEHADVYLDAGYTEEFLWYSIEDGSITANTTNNLQWSGCPIGAALPGAGNACDYATHHLGPVLNSFTLSGGSVTLTAFTDGTNTNGIVRGCGNYTVPPPIDPGLVIPSITGHKFADDNRNGVWDAGEAPLSGWQFEIYLVDSHPWVDQTPSLTTPVGIVQSGSDGKYEFELKGLGPGTYRVVEASQPGWYQTFPAGPAYHDVVVGFGGLDDEYGDNDFGNAQRNADVEKSSFDVTSAPSIVDVGESFEIEITSVVVNNGPADSVPAAETTTVSSSPHDCAVSPMSVTTNLVLSIGNPQTLVHTFTVTCASRSNHHFDFVNDLSIDTDAQYASQLIDPNPGNNARSTGWDLEVFEDVDLDITDLTVVCDEYWTDGPITCTLLVDTANNGPANDVHVQVDASLIGGSDCIISDRDMSEDAVIGVGASATSIFAWTFECAGGFFHTFNFAVHLENHPDDPHAPDSDDASIVWVPLDIKPNSDPNSINMKRRGVTALAILGTPEFDPLTQIDWSTLTFGPTGYEASVVRCGLEGEDANGDGILDLVCQFNVRDTGFSAGDQLGFVRGFLHDGTAFIGADEVRILNG